jgi:hypothetical protein
MRLRDGVLTLSPSDLTESLACAALSQYAGGHGRADLAELATDFPNFAAVLADCVLDPTEPAATSSRKPWSSSRTP